MDPTVHFGLSEVGIVAGSGQLPIHLAREARQVGLRVIGIAHKNETASEFFDLCDVSQIVKIGQLGKVISFFKRHKVKKIIFAGGISRPNLLKGNVWPDRRGLAVLLKAGTVKDDVILRAIATEFEREGISVGSVSDVLKRFIPQPGVLTARGLTELEKQDALVGWESAKIIGQADIGQTVVVSQGMVVAVEAVEGTDAAIKRGGYLAAGHGGVVVKTCKPQQDERLDLPTVGVQTIKNIKAANLSALVIEAGRSIVLEPDLVIKEANACGIAIESR